MSDIKKKVEVELSLTDRLSQAADRAAATMSRMGQAMARSLATADAAIQRVHGGLEMIQASARIREKILQPGLDAAAAVQAALKDVELSLDVTDASEKLKALQTAKENAMRVAAPTPFSTAEVLGIQVELQKAGISSRDAAGKGGAAEATAMLAAAEKMDPMAAAQAMITLSSVFSVSGDQFMTGANLISKASAASSAGAADISAALSQAAGAGMAGMSMADTLAAIGTLSQAGIKGSAAGSYVSSFLRESAQNNAKQKLGVYDNQGNLKDLAGIAEALRTRFGGMSEEKRTAALSKAFGDEGGKLAAALLKPGMLEQVQAGMAGGRSLDDLTRERGGVYAGRVEALGGTVEAMLASLFTPALDPLSFAAAKLNDAAGSIGDAAEKNPALAKAVSYGAIGATVAPLLFALTKGGPDAFRALMSGQMGGLAGKLAGTAGGTAAGMAVQKASGGAVQPVYITNWPAGFGGPSLPGGVPIPTAAAAGGGLLGKVGPLAAAGAAGWGVGTAINDNLIKGSRMESLLNSYMAQVALSSPMRMFASEEDVKGYTKQANADPIWKAIRDVLQLNVKVDVDSQGIANVVATNQAGEVKRAASRTGVL